MDKRTLFRMLHGGDMEGMNMDEADTGRDEMGMLLPEGALHFKCTGLRTISYENKWMLPFLLLVVVLVPWGWLKRMDGIAQQDITMRNRGYLILSVAWLINLFFLLFENGINHAPEDQIPYSNKIVYLCYILLIPAYIVARDFGKICSTRGPQDDSANCCCMRNRGPGLCSMFVWGQTMFWEYGMMALASVGMAVCGFWSTISCHDVQIELGHWVPFLGFLAYAGILLYFAGHRKNRILLQYAEGWCWVAWGVVFNVYFTFGSGGGLLYPYLHNGEISPNWSPDQQHIFQAVMYIFIGGMAIVLGKMGQVSGLPILLLGYNMWAMLDMHPQYCALAKTMHVLAGQLFMVVGVLRFFDRIFETAVVMAVLSGSFVMSTNCSVVWGDANFESVSFITVVQMFWGSWFMYAAYLFKDHWLVERGGEESNGDVEKVNYAAVVSATDDNC